MVPDSLGVVMYVMASDFAVNNRVGSVYRTADWWFFQPTSGRFIWGWKSVL